MVNFKTSFSGFAVKDLAAARQFYGETLGIPLEENDGIGLILRFNDNHQVFIYEKPDQLPAEFTILNFPVDNIDAVVTDMIAAGVKFEHYDNPDMPQDELGILRGRNVGMGPDIAWFRDPSGNILSVLQN